MKGPYFAQLAYTPMLVSALLLPMLAIAQVAPVELTTVERRDIIESLRLSGLLTSPKASRLSPDVEGRLVRLDVDAGARVKSGDILFKLDDELARLELAQATSSKPRRKHWSVTTWWGRW